MVRPLFTGARFLIDRNNALILHQAKAHGLLVTALVTDGLPPGV